MDDVDGEITVDTYLDRIGALADIAASRGVLAEKFLEDSLAENGDICRELERLVAVRRETIIDDDVQAVQGYMATNILAEIESEDRLAWVVLWHDLAGAVARAEARRRCRRYSNSDAVFGGDPAILPRTHNNELIFRTDLQLFAGSQYAGIGSGYGVLDPALPAHLVAWSLTQFPNAKHWIRLVPDSFWDTQPEGELLEFIVQPARPEWWRNLSLRSGSYTGSRYILEACTGFDASLGETADAYDQRGWEYDAKGVRRLEVYWKRDTKGNLSLLAEEVTEPRVGGDPTVMRCLHLDTSDPAGTPFSDASLAHLDLAVNIYDKSLSARLDHSITSGAQVPADCRTHIYRVEGVPLSAVTAFARRFFDGQYLVEEWIADQFAGDPTPAP
jgi:hypothetical protein